MKIISKIYQKINDKMAKHEAAKTLQAMPDYLLADLGLNRYEIQERVYGAAQANAVSSVHYIDIEDRHIVGTLSYAN